MSKRLFIVHCNELFVDCNKLFVKVMNVKLPKSLINMLRTCYNNASYVARWMSILSYQFALVAGVGQGGVVSPVLFAVCVNSVLVKLHSSKTGCLITHMCCS